VRRNARPVGVTKYEEVMDALRRAYDCKVAERSGKEIAPWKMIETCNFLSLLQAEKKTDLLEIGAGTGTYGKFFQEHAMRVTCTDLSSEMVRHCREKGLTAHEMDFMNLDFPPNTFDAVFAMNCLLHVPKEILPLVLDSLHRLMRQNGLFYWGQYGGMDREGPWEEDHYEPKRFFALYLDDDLREIAGRTFEVVSFRRIELADESGMHFQALTLRKSLLEGRI
jgi:SAM-dependent methyltransferase